MSINLNTDCAIRVLLSLYCAGCSVTVSDVNDKTDSTLIGVDCVISKLIKSKLYCYCPDNPDQHYLIILPGKVTLKCNLHAFDAVTQIDFEPDKKPNMSLSNIVFSALDNRLIVNL